MGFLRELRERNVFKVGAIYVVVAWALAQVASTFLPNLNAPDWVLSVFLFFLLLGFPVALIMAWALELTPDGIRRAEPTVGEKRMWTISILFGVLSVGWYFYDAPDMRISQAPLRDSAGTNFSARTGQGVSIAVLPFLDFSPDKDQDYFALGMSEELLNVLAKVRGLSVASRTSSFAYAGSPQSAQEIGRELGVQHVLEGSIRKAGNRLRITAQLIDVDSDRHLWSETYDRDIADIFAIQDDIATAIVGELHEPLGISRADASVNVAAETSNLDAYTLFLEGREQFRIRRIGPAIETMEKVVEMDPGFARAWELLAAIYVVAPGWVPDKRPFFELAKSAAERALAMDETLAMPYAVLGSYAMSVGMGDLPLAREYLARALELDPDNATTHSWMALVWVNGGYFDRAMESFRACLEADPHYINCRRNTALLEVMLGDVDRGLALYGDVLVATSIGLDEPAYVGAYLEAGERVTALLLGNQALEALGIDMPGWIELIEQPRPALKDRRERFRDALVAVQSDAGYFMGTHVNYFLAAIGHPEEVRLNSYDYLWPLLHIPAYVESGAITKHLRIRSEPALWQEFGLPPHCEAIGDGDYYCEKP